jgi:hypothetical protein
MDISPENVRRDVVRIAAMIKLATLILQISYIQYDDLLLIAAVIVIIYMLARRTFEYRTRSWRMVRYDSNIRRRV